MFDWGPALMMTKTVRWVWGQMPTRLDKAVIVGGPMYRRTNSLYLYQTSWTDLKKSLQFWVSICRMRGLEQIRGCRLFSGKEMLFIKQKPGECMYLCCWGRVIGSPFWLYFQTYYRENMQPVWPPPQEPWRFFSKRGPLVMWQVRRQRLAEGAGTAVSSAES